MQSELSELSHQAKEDGRAYANKRWVYGRIFPYLQDQAFISLVGPRGAGKTILLKQLLASTSDGFYISLDTTHLPGGLYETAKELQQSGVKRLLLDEIHLCPGFERELKKISDFIPIQVLFTSSCALALEKSRYDLSRRVRQMRILPFSFAEFVFFERGERLPLLKVDELMDLSRCRQVYGSALHHEPLFEQYLQGRNYPFTLRNHKPKAMFESILQTVLQKDLLMTGEIRAEEIPVIEQMVRFIGLSRAEDMSYSSIAKNLGLTKYKVIRYCEALEKAFILRRVLPAGTNVLREPKILLALPYRLNYRAMGECIGDLREDFFAEAAAIGDWPLQYFKGQEGQKMPDYLLDKLVIEVGGISKGPRQLRGAEGLDKLVFTHPGKMDATHRPLFFAGLIEARTAD